MNRDLSRRIRTVNGITSHRAVVRADIKLGAKIIQNLDSRWGLWAEEETLGQDNPVCVGVWDKIERERVCMCVCVCVCREGSVGVEGVCVCVFL